MHGHPNAFLDVTHAGPDPCADTEPPCVLGHRSVSEGGRCQLTRTGLQIRVPERPDEVMINANYDILAR